MFASYKSSALFLLVFSFAALLIAPMAYAQRPTLLRRFTTLNGTIYFLPGAWVNIWENGRSIYYKYQGGRFVKSPELPKLLRNWESFSWDDGVDFSNQIIRSQYDPSINKFLPKEKKVKKLIEFSLTPHGHEDLVLVCFTLKDEDPSASQNDTDIYMTGLLRSQGTSSPTYKELWTRTMETDASYGNFSVQKVPGNGRFLVLYWGQAAGSGAIQGLDIYQIAD